MIQNISFSGRNYIIPANKLLDGASTKDIAHTLRNATAVVGDELGCRIKMPAGCNVNMENIIKFNPDMFDKNGVLTSAGLERIRKMYPGVKTFGDLQSMIKTIVRCNALPETGEKITVLPRNLNILG